MHLNLEKTAMSAFGYLLCMKLFFLFFSPTEAIMSVGVPLVFFFAYGIQTTKWVETSTLTITGFSVFDKSVYYVQYRVWGIVPISKAQIVHTQVGVLNGVKPKKVIDFFKKVGPILLPLLPLGGVP